MTAGPDKAALGDAWLPILACPRRVWGQSETCGVASGVGGLQLAPEPTPKGPGRARETTDFVPYVCG